MFLAIDPGKTTGYAKFDSKTGKPLAMGEVKYEDIFNWVNLKEWIPVTLYVVEDYIIRPPDFSRQYKHKWSKGEALRVIGAIEAMAASKGAEVVYQQPSILPLAAGLIGYPYNPKKHVDNRHSAILHGSYYWFNEYGPDKNATIETPASSEDSNGNGDHRPARVTQISGWKGLRG